jgi:hypothetical protein
MIRVRYKGGGGSPGGSSIVPNLRLSSHGHLQESRSPCDLGKADKITHDGLLGQ